MAAKDPTAVSTAADMSKDEVASSASGDVEAQAYNTADSTGHLKRDLSSRHINMIAIAGMIVSIPST
jgi:amino acid permease